MPALINTTIMMLFRNVRFYVFKKVVSQATLEIEIMIIKSAHF